MRVERWSGQVARRQGLTAEELAEIRALAERCNAADGLDLKLNWDLMQTRAADETSDFCARDDGHLIGYVALDGVGAELELTGMVRPEFRRRGICRALVAAALEECRRRGTEQLLLVSERASASGRAFATALGGRYSFAEYHMECDARDGLDLLASRLQLRRAAAGDLPLLAELQQGSFDDGFEAALERLTHYFHEPGSRYYIAMHEGTPVGKLGVVLEAGQVYIRGVGILPEHRRRGHGRQMLAATIRALLADGQTHFALDVVTENENALGLYQSCGFRETNVYEYYDVPLG